MFCLMPHATLRLRPNKTACIPTYALPATSNVPPLRRTSYQQETASNAICGSLATVGLPLALRRPLTTQLLLPIAPSGSPAAARPDRPHANVGHSPPAKGCFHH